MITDKDAEALASAEALILLGKRHGVRRLALSGGGVEVEYWPDGGEAPLSVPLPEVLKHEKGPKCLCGHELDVDHPGGVCLRGCDPEVCVRTAATEVQRDRAAADAETLRAPVVEAAGVAK